ncbi:artemin [Leucoraja erinacea]|uniref:artemin n=1 Tax=Leucoraja erinaceus TaxID=7782 RepID=UPI002456BB51|nr:artemin [Leucoraja erinacea]
MSYKVGRVLPARRRSACLRPWVQGSRVGRRPASDRCKQVSEDIHLTARRGLADSPSKPLRRWKATSWTLAIILSMVVSTIASSQEENRLPEYHPRSRKILVQDKSSTSMESQATPKSKTEERRELPTQSVWAADYNATSTTVRAGGHVEDLQNRHQRSPGSSHQGKISSRRNRGRESSRVNRGCQINSQTVKVGNLGLGYESEEIVLFKYCSGSCARSRTNYDLTLSHMLKSKEIRLNKSEKPPRSPCCRPTKYDDVTFLDVKNQWHTLTNFSAVACKCLG